MMSICSRSLHQLERYVDGAPAQMAMKGFFQVRMARSMGFVWCISGGVNWSFALFSLINNSTACEVSLSSLRSCG